MKACDLIVSAPWLLPIAPNNLALKNHALAVAGGIIVAVGPAGDVRGEYSATEDLELSDHVLMPGLVNAHGHLAMTLLRGAGEDESLQDWLEQTIWPLEGRLVNAEFVALGTELAVAEMMSSGTTTFADMYYFPEVVAAVADQCHMRAQIAFPVIERENIWSTSVDDGMHKGLALYDEFRHHPSINIMFGPHAAYTVSSDNLNRINMYANELEAGVQIHLHENRAEVDQAMQLHGKSWIQILHEHDLLGPQVQAVHMTQVSDEDLEIIVASGTAVVHCPTSNLKLASGYCDIERFKTAGVTVGLGTDGAASNNALNLFQEARTAALLAKHHNQNPSTGSAKDMLAMATLGGAQALGLSAQTGSLEPGKDADFITVDMRALPLQPVYDPFAALLHSDAGSHVDHVYVRGHRTVAGGKLTEINEADLLQRVAEWHLESTTP